MKYFFLFLFCSVMAFGQAVSGVVLSEHNTPISGVNVYIDGSQNSSVTTESGGFKLDLKGAKTGNIVFQKEGYEQEIHSIQNIKISENKIILTKYRAIEEVRIIPYTEQAYKNYIQYFLDSFIGNNQTDVKIKNQRTLKFSYDKINKVLRVKAPKTLIIENKKLGYTLHYNLIDFAADFRQNTMSYYGTSFYKETSNKPKIKVNRVNAYLGSPQHFFRSVYAGKVEEEGFWVNYIVKMPNPNYPTKEDLEILKAFREMSRVNLTIKIPKEISEIIRRSRESKFVHALTKTKIPIADYLEETAGKKIFSANDILQVNFNKVPYELKSGKLVKSSLSMVKTSNLYVNGNQFQVFPSGDITTPEKLLTDGYFSENKIENLLPSDYIFGE